MPRPASASSLTTGEIARILGVHACTVTRWISGGHLAGWTTPGGHARVWESEFRRFAEARGISLPEDLTTTTKAA